MFCIKATARCNVNKSTEEQQLIVYFTSPNSALDSIANPSGMSTRQVSTRLLKSFHSQGGVTIENIAP